MRVEMPAPINVTHAGVILQGRELLVAETGREATEVFRVINMVGVSHDGGHCALKGPNASIVLELDNVLARNKLGSAGHDDRSGLRPSRGGGHRQRRQEGEKSCGAHLE